ncbi:MAG: HAD family hydrolase [Planctomycetota bacterium]|jgi:beta-phosphoglucomutase
MFNMLKAVIFDFDGVIADSEPLHYRAFEKTVNHYGIELTKQRYYAKYLGYTDLECTRAISADFNLALDNAGVEKLIADKTKVFAQLVKSENSIIDGVGGFIDMLSPEPVRLAVCSGASLADIELMLDGSDLSGSFEIIVAADDVRKGKPDPEGFLLTLKRMNETSPTQIQPDECIVIEDSRWGLEAASTARMRTIGVTNTYSADQLEPLADAVVSRLDELTMSDLHKMCSRKD